MITTGARLVSLNYYNITNLTGICIGAARLEGTSPLAGLGSLRAGHYHHPSRHRAVLPREVLQGGEVSVATEVQLAIPHRISSVTSRHGHFDLQEGAVVTSLLVVAFG